VGFPTASASSTCLAEILLRQRYGAWPAIEWFDQSEEGPLGRFDATLFIGDVALRRRQERPDLVWTDLGSAWTRWTGLPFVYALWQVHAPPNLNGDVAACARALAESKAAGLENLEGLARRYPDPSPLPRDDLPAYWRGLEYGLGAEVRAGLALFYARAVEIGRLPRVPPLQFVRTASATSAV
jgi:chorismate dehydratase